MTSNTYNGWANYQTWNAALWIGNDEFLYNTAKACVEYCGNDETPWAKFVRCMTDGQIGRMLGQTADGVRWNDPAIDEAEMVEMMTELYVTNSPLLNSWFLKLIVWLTVDIPVWVTINFLLVYPLPPLITLISDIVFLFEAVLKL